MGRNNAGLTRSKTDPNRRDPVYSVWNAMMRRCYNPAASHFEYYGGRGITVCQHWHEFQAFAADMGQRPPGTELDRIDNNGHYEPGNCRWATKSENSRNRRSARMITHDGETKSLADWCESSGLGNTLRNRLKDGWPFERAVSTPVNRRRQAWSEDELAILRASYAPGDASKAAAFLPKRSAMSIHHMARKLGLAATRPRCICGEINARNCPVHQ